MKLKLYRQPPLLFLVMSVIISAFALYLSSTLVLDSIARIIIIAFLVFVLFIFGYLIITAFNQVVETEKLQAELVFVAAHQLRSPLNIFNLVLATLEKQLGETSLVKMLQRSANKMGMALETFLDIGRLENGTFSLENNPFSLVEITNDTVADFKQLADSLEVKLIYKKTPFLDTIGDKGRISMVIQNLIDNAITYSHKGGRVTIKIEKESLNTLRWSIQDSGIGIPKKDQPHIFSKFYRSDNAKKEKAKGTGIGLYVAKRIMEHAGGEMGFTSEENLGTTFYFTLPIA